jgi:hypothetical protein
MKPNISLEMKKENRVNMLITLSFYGRQSVQEDCFDDEMFWAFIHNRLTKDNRIKAMSHLNKCSDCYGKWSEMVSALPKDTDAYQKKSIYAADSYFRIAVSAAAIFIVCLIFFFQSSDIGDLIDQSYQTIVQNVILQKMSPVRIPELSGSLAFSSSATTKPEFKQFIDGIQNGQQMIFHISQTNERVHNQSSNAYYYLLGKWFFLTWQLCHIDKISEGQKMWNSQLKIGQLLSESMPENSSSMVHLWHQLLETMGSQLSTQKKNQQMIFHLENMILLLKD